MHYELRVNGVLGSRSAWVEDLQVTSDERGQTNIGGFIADQVTLHGPLTKARDLHLELLEAPRTGQSATNSEGNPLI